MVYITVDYLKNGLSPAEMSQLTNDVDTSPESDQEILEEAILQAESMVNSYLAVRYKLPAAEQTPPVVKYHTLSIAKYILFSRRSFSMPTKVMEDYEDSIRWLERVANGRVVLYGLALLEVSTDAFSGNAELIKKEDIFTTNVFP